MSGDVVELQELDSRWVDRAGGKAANLGELLRAGFPVPPGFCVTTAGAGRDEIARALGRLGDEPVAVRSSATAEDLPTASFAGLRDSYLDVVGLDAVLDAIERCRASLGNERAVNYRERNGIAEATMAVVVQQMVPAEASGVLFTADPVSGNRRVSVVEAVRGLGDELVAGRMTPDVHRVRDGDIVDEAVVGDRVLTEDEVLRVTELGRRVETHFGRPQDIEWCLAAGEFWIVQSRPITTLFPIPVRDDDANRVYVSVGHQQMMTDPMRPLGWSVFQMTALPPMHQAAGRLFVEVTPQLGAPGTRAGLLAIMGRSDPLIVDALQTVIARDGFVPPAPEAPPTVRMTSGGDPLENDPAEPEAVRALTMESLDALRATIATKSGAEVFDFIRDDIAELKRILFLPRSHQMIMAGMEATWWLNDHLHEWLGIKNAADSLVQSVAGNVTAEMGLALLDVADAVRPHPEVVALLRRADDGFLDELPSVDGGADAQAAIREFLERYGMRCVGEIDITRPRWSERPIELVPAILGNVGHFAPGEAARRFRAGLDASAAAEADVLDQLRAVPDGDAKAAETKHMIDRARTFNGFREFPKYGFISRYAIYKQALVREAERLTGGGVIERPDDAYFLTFAEFQEAVATGVVDRGLIATRAADFRSFHALSPARVMTSEGELLDGSYHRDGVPKGALEGLGVSAGVVEGRARVVLDIGDAELEPGDILVTRFTDPSWTPVFVTVAGLVTEVGGLMTHGAVIAREYGLPAVVGVRHATRLVPDGARIRLHGTEGYIELLDR